MADLDRSEAASPYKLKKAREQGQVAKSADGVGLTTYLATMAWFAWQGWDALKRQFDFDRALLGLAGRVDLNVAVFWHIAEHALWHLASLGGSLLSVIVAAAILGNLLQSGPVFSLEPLKPQWERINPASGLKRMFSMQTLFNALKISIKTACMVAVVYYVLKDVVHSQFYGLAELSPLGWLKSIVDDGVSIGMKLGVVLLIVAAIDVVFTRRQFARRMRMSKRELKDEVKQREGHPRIRARIRKLRQEMRQRSRSVRDTGRADVVITNPTHYAVALRYTHGEMESPQLVAKGAGALAMVMRTIAARQGIPIVRNPPLARKLFKVMEKDQHVPSDLYRDVARIIVWIFAMRREREAGVSGRKQSAT